MSCPEQRGAYTCTCNLSHQCKQFLEVAAGAKITNKLNNNARCLPIETLALQYIITHTHTHTHPLSLSLSLSNLAINNTYSIQALTMLLLLLPPGIH